MLLAASPGLDWGTILISLAIILVAGKAAAELCERVGIPAVLGEILVGIAIGPSLLGFIEMSDAIAVLAELGVIVLLAQVGLEIDVAELRKVGRVSLMVAAIGVIVPMISGFGVGQLLDETTNASLFLGAALAATSVGITARVFGDLRTLNTREARVVLGAAVADDVLGLIILTVITRVVETGDLDPASIGLTILVAVGFVVVSATIGLAVVPRLFRHVDAVTTSYAVVPVVATALTFALAAAADAARLAPIIGAFIAGVTLGRTEQRERIEHEFNVLAMILVPIFFVSIGLTVDVGAFADAKVIGLAALLSVVAVAAKMLAALGARGSGMDAMLVGVAMVPRGEVGLIFASIGASVGVFDDELYAVVVAVVLVTTIVAPPLLRWRIRVAADLVS
jgi:Kef-type K+ transport system membrane component KefB